MNGTATLAFHPKENSESTQADRGATEPAETDRLSTIVSPTMKWPYVVYAWGPLLKDEPDDSEEDLLDGQGEEHGIKTLSDLVAWIPRIFGPEVLHSEDAHKGQESDKDADDAKDRFQRPGIYAVSIDVDMGHIVMVHEELNTPNNEALVSALLAKSENRFSTEIRLEPESST